MSDDIYEITAAARVELFKDGVGVDELIMKILRPPKNLFIRFVYANVLKFILWVSIIFDKRCF